LVSTLGSAVISARAELGSIIASRGVRHSSTLRLGGALPWLSSGAVAAAAFTSCASDVSCCRYRFNSKATRLGI
jgi:hypothetical protein